MKEKEQTNLNNPLPPYFEFQPSEFCPKNFVIFDKTENRNKTMFNPIIANQFVSTGFNTGPIETNEAYDHERSNEMADSCSLEDESGEINALLSLDDMEDEDDDDVSTASSVPVMGNRGKIKEMVERLREIVPGGEHMPTAGVLDEAVKYLKSLKVEVEKLGVDNIPSEMGSSSANGSC